MLQIILTNFLSVFNSLYLERIRTNKNADETEHTFIHGEAKTDKKDGRYCCVNPPEVKIHNQW